MKRNYAVAAGLLVVVACVLTAFYFLHNRPSPAVQEKGTVVAYADVEHIMMSHPGYAQYHHLQLEYNTLVAQYQFEQWNYSHRAQAQGKAEQDFSMTDALSTQALNQELQARIAIKQTELNDTLQQQAKTLLAEKKESQPVLSEGDSVKIVNLRIKLASMMLTQAERAAIQQELQSLQSAAQSSPQADAALAEAVAKEMAPYKEEAQKQLEAYALQVHDELQARQAEKHDAFRQQMAALGNRPDPAIWNKDWKEKLDQKKQEIDEQEERIMDGIREKAAIVARERGIDLIVCDYEGVGTAEDVTDDIIAKLM